MTKIKHPAVIPQVETVLDALEKFINQRPGLDPANYGAHREQLQYSTREQRIEARRAMQGDARTIQKDGTRARKALIDARRHVAAGNGNAAIMAQALGEAFSGRLSWEGSRLEYCTGQYFCTEYRAAAATVLERFNYLARPKFTPERGEVFTTIEQIKTASYNVGSHWFEHSSMRFFNSRILSDVFHGAGGVYFVSSEKGPNGIRRHTVRKFNPETADISSFGPFNELTRERALRIARIAAEYPDAAREALGVEASA